MVLAEDVWDALKRHAVPLDDDVNSVLRRLLGVPDADLVGPEALPKLDADGSGDQFALQSALALPAALNSGARKGPGKRSKATKAKTPRNPRATKKQKPPRAARGSILPEEEYELPILRALSEHGGRAASRTIVDRVGELLGDDLREADFETLTSGAIRWKNRVQFVRLKLIQAGQLSKDAPRGFWEITPQGTERVRASGSRSRRER